MSIITIALKRMKTSGALIINSSNQQFRRYFSRVYFLFQVEGCVEFLVFLCFHENEITKAKRKLYLLIHNVLALLFSSEKILFNGTDGLGDSFKFAAFTRKHGKLMSISKSRGQST